MDNLQVGDVLRRGNTYRIVRAVSPAHDPKFVTFAIKRCSWTRRPYTVYLMRDLRKAGWVKVEGVRVKLDTLLDRLVKEDMQSQDRVITCCDVIGVLS